MYVFIYFLFVFTYMPINVIENKGIVFCCLFVLRANCEAADRQAGRQAAGSSVN
jgi:hypothetical protein